MRRLNMTGLRLKSYLGIGCTAIIGLGSIIGIKGVSNAMTYGASSIPACKERTCTLKEFPRLQGHVIMAPVHYKDNITLELSEYANFSNGNGLFKYLSSNKYRGHRYYFIGVMKTDKTGYMIYGLTLKRKHSGTYTSIDAENEMQQAFMESHRPS